MAAYYNENDKFAAAWLRELIKPSTRGLLVSNAFCQVADGMSGIAPMSLTAILGLRLISAARFVHAQVYALLRLRETLRTIRKPSEPSGLIGRTDGSHCLAETDLSCEPGILLPSTGAYYGIRALISRWLRVGIYRNTTIYLLVLVSVQTIFCIYGNRGRQTFSRHHVSCDTGPCSDQNNIFCERVRSAFQFYIRRISSLVSLLMYEHST